MLEVLGVVGDKRCGRASTVVGPRPISNRKYTDRTLASSKATYVCCIAGGDDGFVELESSRDHEGVDRMGG